MCRYPKGLDTERYGYYYMKKLQQIFVWVCAIGILCAVHTPACQVQAAPVLYTEYDETSIEDTSVTMTVSCSSTLLVRSGPGKTYDRLGSVNNGDQVEVTGICSNGWYRISFEKKEGYVYGDYLVDSKSAGSDDMGENTMAESTETEADGDTDTMKQWFSSLDLPSILPLAIPVVIILILAISALIMFRSIRRDTAEEEDEEEDGDEDEDEEEDDEELTTRVMRKSTPLPKVSGNVTGKMDSNMLESQIRNFVVDDIGKYLDEKTNEEDREFSELEEELEATQQHLLELQKQMEQLKNKR